MFKIGRESSFGSGRVPPGQRNVSSVTDNETELASDETIFRGGEESRKPALVTRLANETTGHIRPNDRGRHDQGSFGRRYRRVHCRCAHRSPGFAPQVEASVPRALAKADRLDIRGVGKDCSQQAWPNFEASCLRSSGSKATVLEARLVTADRTP